MRKRWVVCLSCLLAPALNLPAEVSAWRIPIEVRAGEVVVEAELGWRQFRTQAKLNLALVEVDNSGKVIDRDVPYQLDAAEDPGKRLLTFVLKGSTPAAATRRFRLDVGGQPTDPPERLVKLEHLDDHEGYPAVRITTPRATYVYHKRCAGFASLIDNDGNDWISYHPEGGFEGDYRGIPNIAPPQFHPGRPEGKSQSRLLRLGAVRATLRTETEDGNWDAVWDIYPNYATMTLIKKDPAPYWILYEGTPGGSFDTWTDYWVHSDATRIPVKEVTTRWNDRLPDPQWVYFGDTKMKRVLFLALHEPDEEWDEFWHRGSGGMTVFGFGRGPKPQWQYLETTPAHLTIGLVEEDQFEQVKAEIESSWREIEVSVGTPAK